MVGLSPESPMLRIVWMSKFLRLVGRRHTGDYAPVGDIIQGFHKGNRFGTC